MSLIHIISIGKLTKDFTQIAAHYHKMIRWQVKNSEITYQKKLPEAQIKQYEAKLIKEKMSSKSYKIILDMHGKNFTNQQLAELFLTNKYIEFIIGGAFGLSNDIMGLSDLQLSISPLTLPHQMVKIILLEQIYRSQTIIDGHPYHK